MYILTDGKYYVIRNELKPEKLMKSTCASKAEEFSFKQARQLLQGKKSSTKWIKNEKFYMVNVEDNQKVDPKMSNSDSYVGKNDIQFDSSIYTSIYEEVNSILSLKTFDKKQLITYKNLLQANQSKYDSAETDILHAIETYKAEKGKNPQAHKMTKIYILIEEVRAERRKIKQCLGFVNTMIEAIDKNYSVEKLKLNLSKLVNNEYKGRTEYYAKTLELLG